MHENWAATWLHKPTDSPSRLYHLHFPLFPLNFPPFIPPRFVASCPFSLSYDLHSIARVDFSLTRSLLPYENFVRRFASSRSLNSLYMKLIYIYMNVSIKNIQKIFNFNIWAIKSRSFLFFLNLLFNECFFFLRFAWNPSFFQLVSGTVLLQTFPASRATPKSLRCICSPI